MGSRSTRRDLFRRLLPDTAREAPPIASSPSSAVTSAPASGAHLGVSQPPPAHRPLRPTALEGFVERAGLRGRRAAVFSLLRASSRVVSVDAPSVRLPRAGGLAVFDLTDPAAAPLGCGRSGSLVLCASTPAAGLVERVGGRAVTLRTLDASSGFHAIRGRPVRLAPELVLPRAWSEVVQSLGLDARECDAWETLRDELARAQGTVPLDAQTSDAAPLHRIGGYPDDRRGRMRLMSELAERGIEPTPDALVAAGGDEAVLRAARRWRLVFQLAADPGLGVRWGDAHERLYVWRDATVPGVGRFHSWIV